MMTSIVTDAIPQVYRLAAYPAVDSPEYKRWLLDELRRLELVVADVAELVPHVHFREPADKRRGHVAYADNVGWQPGQGEGLYLYDGSAWRKVTVS